METSEDRANTMEMDILLSAGRRSIRERDMGLGLKATMASERSLQKDPDCLDPGYNCPDMLGGGDCGIGTENCYRIKEQRQ